MIQLNDLGEDIILSHIIQYLNSDDIISLSLTSHHFHEILSTNEAYHKLYLKLFGSKPVPLNLNNYDWKTLFNLRVSKRAKFYTWGSQSNFRLGHAAPDASDEFRNFVGCSIPHPVEGVEDLILTNITSGGFSFQMLTINGELFWTGTRWSMSNSTPPGPRQRDYDPKDRPIRNVITGIATMPGIFRRYNNSVVPATTTTEPDERRETNPNLRLPPEQQVSLPRPTSVPKVRLYLPKFVNQFELHNETAKLVSISSGREQVLGLDANGKVYSWDSGTKNNKGIGIKFPGIPEVDQKVVKISAGWNLSSCYIEGIGLIVWYSRDSLSQSDFEAGIFEVNAKYIIIPGTANTIIVDFMSGNDNLLYIKGNGKLYRFDIDIQVLFNENNDSSILSPPFEVLNFNSWLTEYNLIIVGEGTKFSKITGCYNSFALFTDDGKVLLGDKRRSSREENQERYDDDDDEYDNSVPVDGKGPIIIPELQDRRVKDVVIGDYHYLALTDDGELLSWGTESRGCGCLGLGKVDANDIIKVPTTVHSPKGSHSKGKWLAVAAAGWQSCGIFIEDDD